MTPPLLSKPKTNEPLQLYIAVSTIAVSAVLTREDDEAGQLLVYYVSKTLLPSEVRYTSLEKLSLALFNAVKKLRHYFETHHVVVMTNYPLKSVLRKPDLTGRLGKWSISLSTMDIEYQPRKAIKSQALADFVADFSPDLQVIADKELEEINSVQGKGKWILFVDGSSNQRGEGLGMVLKSPQGDMIVRSVSCDFKATNNEAEYEALIAGMTVAKDLGATSLDVYIDSLLIIIQVTGDFAAKDSKMSSYLDIAKEKSKHFNPFIISQIPRDQNIQADALENLASALRKNAFTNIPLVHLQKPSVSFKEILPVDDVNNDDDWTRPIIDYLTKDILPNDKADSRKLKYKASRYHIIDGVLFRKSASGLSQRCIRKSDQQSILSHLHDGICSSHVGGRRLANIAKRQGYFWPKLHEDAMQYVTKCDSCQQPTPFINHQSPSTKHYLRGPS
ncbi:uncharacterized protein LOC110694851 [Chenopodium quinoa]|uniref:uncharacterized protein LOC110694851 n=1 Tax=Chenopodium quinoa TaxID=63459 RepID=UPI000B78114E|nr:uncharacterized protein LOC110694851 [Chenopodium quinoa]